MTLAHSDFIQATSPILAWVEFLVRLLLLLFKFKWGVGLLHIEGGVAVTSRTSAHSHETRCVYSSICAHVKRLQSKHFTVRIF